MIHFRYKPFKHQKNNSRVRSGRKVLPALVLTAAFLLPAGISSADRSSDPGYVVYADENDEIQEIRDKNKEREKKIAEAQARLQSLNTAVADIREVIAELDQQIGDYRIQIINLTNERNAVQAEIAVTESNLQLAYIAEANQYENMKERIAYAYENGDVKYIDALIALDDFSDVINQSEYVEQVSSYDQQQLNKLISIKQEIRAQETLLADKLAQILEIKADTEAEQAALEITVEGKKDLLNEYGEQIYATNGEITTYQQLIEEGNYEIQRLDAEYRRKQEEAKRKKKAAEEARKKAAEEAKNAKNEAAKKAAEEAQKAAEEEARKAEEAEKKAAEELARKTSEEEALREAEEAARKEQENTEEPETEEPTTVPPSSDDSDTDDSGSDDSDYDDSDSDDSDSDDSDSDDSDQDSDFSEVTPSNIWLWPCPSSHSIASYFGYRTPPCKGATSYHEAIDIGCHIGTNVVAASSGRVMYTSYSFARGNYIKLDHGNGITTLYQHLSSFAGYSSGDYVEAGTVIAYSGDTGICSAPHLHFEVAVNDTPVNPLNYVSP